MNESGSVVTRVRGLTRIRLQSAIYFLPHGGRMAKKLTCGKSKPGFGVRSPLDWRDNVLRDAKLADKYEQNFQKHLAHPEPYAGR